MAAVLSDFLRSTARARWAWGGLAGVDCTMWVSDWVRARTGYDPAEPYRGVYATADECHALIKREGGFLPLIASRMDERFVRTQNPREGDVGVITVAVDPGLGMPACGAIAAIRGQGLWHARMLRGVRGGDWPCVTAWEIG